MAKLSRSKVWPSLNYSPHQGQRIVHASPARHRVLSAGRRFGKSTIGGHELVPEALITHTQRELLLDNGKRREFWIIGPEYSDSEKEFRILWNDAKRLKLPMDRPGSYNNPETGDLVMSLWNGTFMVHAKSAKYPSTLVGEGLSGVILSEAAKLKPSVWLKYVRPALADFRGWSLMTSTPEGKNWFYEMWQAGQDETRKQWASWRIASWFNDRVFPEGRMDEEILDMERDMSEEKFNQEVGADFTEFVGRVFKDFDEEIHVRRLAYNPQWALYGACDYGWTNPFVWLSIQVDNFDNVYVLGEYRSVHKDITDIAKDLQRWPQAYAARKFYPDPAEPGDTNVLSKVLKVQSVANTGGELKWRLELIRQALKLGPKHAAPEQQKPRLYIDRSCTELIREMLDYRYPEQKNEEKPNKEEPMDKDDHGPEALGRFFRGYFGAPATDGNRVIVRKANVG